MYVFDISFSNIQSLTRHLHLQLFTCITLSLSRKGVPTICLTLLLYKIIESHLKAMQTKYQKNKLYTALL
jgi:hypothetical protein